VHDSSNESQKEKLFSWLNRAAQDAELYKIVALGIWWHWVSIALYWLIHDVIKLHNANQASSAIY